MCLLVKMYNIYQHTMAELIEQTLPQYILCNIDL